MSQVMEEGPLREVAILTRAVENVLRKLIRLLVGRMSLTRLQEMIRIIFVEEAEAKLKRERPGRNVPLTKLALLTGLDTRTLARANANLQKRGPFHKEKRFLKEITPECSILDFWESNSKYLQDDGEHPLVLNIRGNTPSFESLVRETLSSRGVTAKSLLERLEASRSIEIDHANGTVKMLDRRYWPIEQKDKTASLEIGLISVGNLVETVVHNLETQNHAEEAFFQRASWTHRLNRKNQKKLRKQLSSYLKHAQEGAIDIMRKFEEDEIGDDQVTAGVSLFYFEEEPSFFIS